ncbi:hypothetical protein BH20ACI3_BH20ACI3_19960 [soil metagenome]
MNIGVGTTWGERLTAKGSCFAMSDETRSGTFRTVA